MSKNETRISDALDQLRITDNLFCAGIPGYLSNFTRDSFVYGLTAQNIDALQGQIEYCMKLQGTHADPMTGEEVGKIHHENPGILFRERLTTYNACDSTALYLLGICAIIKNRNDPKLLEYYKASIKAGLAYIESHVVEDIFYEDPKHAGADDFALRVTYWKDSVINSSDEHTNYPIVYTLAQFQNALALHQVGKLLGDDDLVDMSLQMFDAGIKKLWNQDHFVTAIDGTGHIIDPPSSDSLHSLLLIPQGVLPKDYAEHIELYSAGLETTAGYRTGVPQANISDNYHTNYVWSHEQALIHCASRSYGLEHAQVVSMRITEYLDTIFTELVNAQTFEPAGNPLQLWAVGACEYFEALSDKDSNPFIPYT